MARCVFFSFYYAGDIRRVVQVRNAWQFGQGNTTQKIYDRGIWEKAKANGPQAIEKIIEEGLTGTSVTVVLIGTKTASRHWVKYEIRRTIEEGKGIVGVRIHNIRDPLAARTRIQGPLAARVRPSGPLAARLPNPIPAKPLITAALPATSKPGLNPLAVTYRCAGIGLVQPSRFYKTFDWVNDDGYRNLGDWVEEAARVAGR